MEQKLPARPNLEHLRTQAKTLLSGLREGDDATIQTFIEHLPAARDLTPDQVRRAEFRLTDAQSAIARKTGFSKWPALAKHVEQLRAFEGVWEFVDLEMDGAAIPEASIQNSRLLMDGDRFRMQSPEANFEGIFRIDVEQAPNQIDIEFVEGPEAGNWSYGIYELAGDHLRICLGIVGASRPKDFATSPGSGHALETLRRASRSRPKSVEGGVRQPTDDPVAVDQSGFEAQMSPLLAKLEGDWVPVQVVRDGQALPDRMLTGGLRSGTGNETKVILGGHVMVHAKVRVDESQPPIAIDYLDIGKSSPGSISLGIMDWIGDEVRFCMASTGDPRPTNFSSEPGSGRTFSQWRRK